MRDSLKRDIATYFADGVGMLVLTIAFNKFYEVEIHQSAI